MRSRIHLRRAVYARPVATLLTAVLLSLSVSAGFHRGDHDDLGWLPSRFHHHDFQWRAGTGEEAVPLIDHCLACHVTRTLVRFSPAVAAPPESPVPVQAWSAGAAGDLPGRPESPRTPRAPPAS